ncbi:MAG: hypothetical protein A3C36_01425 [Omnitrophica WOR_2 bacterium RIFCSPHIGHO2_02_FULL_52_10]|nr:MAG: hypothetical protein A3C36_01425 [Omnitrophica WOR_2 bacterium RIFCSPHIGHO2_02_FULL_52_10]
MKRIGIAASKISKGNLVLYHVYVVLISLLFSLFIFLVAGSTVLFALVIIQYVGSEIMGIDFERRWESILAVCMVSLTVIITLFNLAAILINLRIPKLKD